MLLKCFPSFFPSFLGLSILEVLNFGDLIHVFHFACFYCSKPLGDLHGEKWDILFKIDE